MQGLHPWPVPGFTLSDLPALELEDPLHGVLVLPQQPGDGGVASIGQGIIHPFDTLSQDLINLRPATFRFVAIRPARYTRQRTGFTDCDLVTFLCHLGNKLLYDSSVDARWRCN